VVPDTVLLVCCAQRDGWNDRTSFLAGLGSDMDGTSSKAVLARLLDAVGVQRVTVQECRGHVVVWWGVRLRRKARRGKNKEKREAGSASQMTEVYISS
jgi:hypothetical protein